jgi:hypothetical protein
MRAVINIVGWFGPFRALSWANGALHCKLMLAFGVAKPCCGLCLVVMQFGQDRESVAVLLFCRNQEDPVVAVLIKMSSTFSAGISWCVSDEPLVGVQVACVEVGLSTSQP